MDLSLILEVSDLTVGPVTPGSAAILDGISFRLNTSDIFGIYGESGAGKTVLSRALANWLPESLEYRAGQVAFAGHDISARNPQVPHRPRHRLYRLEAAELARSDDAGGKPDRREAAQRQAGMGQRECRERVIQLLSEVRIPFAQGALLGLSSEIFRRHDAACDDRRCDLRGTRGAHRRQHHATAGRHHRSPDRGAAPRSVPASPRWRPSICHPRCRPSASSADRTAILHQGRFVEQQAFAELLAAPKTDYTRKAIASVPRMWSTAEGPLARRQARGEVPLMQVQEVHQDLSRPQAPATFNSYSDVQAVRGVTLDIMPRENFGIVGESGCGKSTLTRLLAWLEVPDQGGILLNGTSLGGLSGAN